MVLSGFAQSGIEREFSKKGHDWPIDYSLGSGFP